MTLHPSYVQFPRLHERQNSAFYQIFYSLSQTKLILKRASYHRKLWGIGYEFCVTLVQHYSGGVRVVGGETGKEFCEIYF